MNSRITRLVPIVIMAFAGAAVASQAIAQEAIMLETIGAVRMASPNDVRRMNDEALHQRQHTGQPAATLEHHAAFTE